MKPHVCPVREGADDLPAMSGGDSSAMMSCRSICKACGGKCVVWEPGTSIAIDLERLVPWKGRLIKFKELLEILETVESKSHEQGVLTNDSDKLMNMLKEAALKPVCRGGEPRTLC